MASTPVYCWMPVRVITAALFRMGVAYSGAPPVKRLTFVNSAYIIT